MNKYTLSIKDLSSKEMQYNTQQKRMPLPEYGRSIQNMVDYALTIKIVQSVSVVPTPLSI